MSDEVVSAGNQSPQRIHLIRRIFEVADHPKNLPLSFEGQCKRYPFYFNKARGTHVYSVVVDDTKAFPGSIDKAQWKFLKKDICRHNSRHHHLEFDAELVEVEIIHEEPHKTLEQIEAEGETPHEVLPDGPDAPNGDPQPEGPLPPGSSEASPDPVDPGPPVVAPVEPGDTVQLPGAVLVVHRTKAEEDAAAGILPSEAEPVAVADSDLPPGSVPSEPVETPAPESDLPPGSVSAPVEPEIEQQTEPEAPAAAVLPETAEPQPSQDSVVVVEEEQALDATRKYSKKALLDLNVDQLKALCKERKITGFSRASEATLVSKNLEWQKANL